MQNEGLPSFFSGHRTLIRNPLAGTVVGQRRICSGPVANAARTARRHGKQALFFMLCPAADANADAAVRAIPTSKHIQAFSAFAPCG